MTRAEFWALIAAAHTESPTDIEHQAKVVADLLAQRPSEEIIAFDRILGELMAESYRADLWGAAYIINSGCSDDGFDYFRGWLITQGEAVFTEALRSPDSLAIVERDEDEEAECESLLYAALEAYEARNGSEMPLEMRAELPNLVFDWTEDDVEIHYPALAARYGA